MSRPAKDGFPFPDAVDPAGGQRPDAVFLQMQEHDGPGTGLDVHAKILAHLCHQRMAAVSGKEERRLAADQSAADDEDVLSGGGPLLQDLFRKKETFRCKPGDGRDDGLGADSQQHDVRCQFGHQ